MANQMICAQCGTVGNPERFTRGSIWITLFLFLCGVLPGILYAVWRWTSEYDGCSKCGGPNLLPMDSPVGRKMMNEMPEVQHSYSEHVKVQQEKSARMGDEIRIVPIIWMIVVAGLLGIFFWH